MKEDVKFVRRHVVNYKMGSTLTSTSPFALKNASLKAN